MQSARAPLPGTPSDRTTAAATAPAAMRRPRSATRRWLSPPRATPRAAPRPGPRRSNPRRRRRRPAARHPAMPMPWTSRRRRARPRPGAETAVRRRGPAPSAVRAAARRMTRTSHRGRPTRARCRASPGRSYSRWPQRARTSPQLAPPIPPAPAPCPALRHLPALRRRSDAKVRDRAQARKRRALDLNVGRGPGRLSKRARGGGPGHRPRQSVQKIRSGSEVPRNSAVRTAR
mmetsp:Transcript_57676/g.154950  ORF Transcript_57676/g.154950 Transcript_57676/m.154950 type:complete len:232 (-) Transcript_57676:635-1330(-)